MVTPEEFLQKNGNICPDCGLSGEQNDTIPLDATDGTTYLGRVFIHVECSHCGATWQERYDLSGWTYLRTGKENAKTVETPVKRVSVNHHYSHPDFTKMVKAYPPGESAETFVEKNVMRNSFRSDEGDNLGNLPEF